MPAPRCCWPIYEAVVHLDDPAAATRRLEAAGRRAVEIGEPGLERLARGYRLLTVRMQGPSDSWATRHGSSWTTTEIAITTATSAIWAASMLALVDRDAARLRQLMDIAAGATSPRPGCGRTG